MKKIFKTTFLMAILAIAGMVILAGCSKSNDERLDDPNNPDNPDNPQGTNAIELTSPINQNTTLKDLGYNVDYVYNGKNLLQVTNNAVLTIEPGVTIKFTHNKGGLEVSEMCQINAVGTKEKPIKFIGSTSDKGSWKCVSLLGGENQFKYCDFIGGGGSSIGVICQEKNSRLSMEYCNIKNANNYGYSLTNNNLDAIIAFNNNTITGSNYAPVLVSWIDHTKKFDMSSDFSGNISDYIEIAGSGSPGELCCNATTINQLNVPYYVNRGVHIGKPLTINEGVTFCFGEDGSLWSGSYEVAGGGDALIVNGTQQKPVTFTRLSGGATYYWDGLWFIRNNGSTLKWCTVEYCKSDGAIYVGEDAMITLNDVTIRNNQQYGVYYNGTTYWGEFEYGTVQHSGVNGRFSNNTAGNVRLADGTVSATLP